MVCEQKPAALAPVAVDALAGDEVAEVRRRRRACGDQRPPEVAVTAAASAGPCFSSGMTMPPLRVLAPPPASSASTTTTERPRPGQLRRRRSRRSSRLRSRRRRPRRRQRRPRRADPGRGRRPSCHQRLLAVTGGERRGHAEACYARNALARDRPAPWNPGTEPPTTTISLRRRHGAHLQESRLDRRGRPDPLDDTDKRLDRAAAAGRPAPVHAARRRRSACRRRRSASGCSGWSTAV